MKKILFSTLALAALTAMTSCSSDEPAMADGNVTFSVELPSLISTRAYSDGLTARHLQYYVYDEDTKAASPLLTGEATFSDRKATISLDLVKGKKYSIVFWADKAGNSFYTYDPATKEVTVDYSGDAQNEDRDAFYAAEPEFLVNGAIGKTITLTRPFAQVNVGTSDWAVADKAGLGLTATGMTVTGVNNKINLATGATSGDVTVTYTPAALPGADEAFPYEPDTYKYLAMNYLLVPGEKTTVDVAVQMTAAQPKEDMTFSAVPVQRNYRTNIFGALLTNPANFNVIIDQEYEKPDYNNVMEVSDAAGMAAALASGTVTTVNVNNDLDLSSLTVDQLTFNTPKTINIATGTTIKLGADNALIANAGLTLKGAGTITNVGSTSPINGYRTLVVANGGDLDIEGVTLIADPDYHYFGTDPNIYYNTGAINYTKNVGKVTIKNATVKSGMYALCGLNRFDNQTVVNISDSYFESTSASSQGTGGWAYAIRLYGSTATFDNVEVKGVQGALAPDGGVKITINGGKYYTENTPGKTDAFYAVYATNNAEVTINGGEFSGARDLSGGLAIEGTSCLVSGDNDVNSPSGTFIIRGGKFSGKAYNHVTKSIYEPADGYSYSPLTGQDPYKWEVVKK